MKIWKTLSIALASFVLVFLLVFCLVPVKTVSYQVTIQKQVKETYYETEPYIVQESYTNQVPYIIQESYQVEEPYHVKRYLDYDIVGTLRQNSIKAGYGAIGWASVLIRNVDSLNGSFTTSFTFRAREQEKTFYDTDKIYLSSNEEGTAEGWFDSWLGENWTWSYDITPEKVTETKYKIVTKYKDVTKYQIVTKYRDVTKYKRVEKERLVRRPFIETRYKNISMLEYLLQ